MRAIHLAIALIVFSVAAVAQKKLPVTEWANRLKDDSKSQVLQHYTVYYDITKIDSASKIQGCS